MNMLTMNNPTSGTYNYYNSWGNFTTNYVYNKKF